MNKEDGLKKVGRKAEIDTRPPFRSVKEAVSLFGDKVLAADLYSNNPNKLKQVNENGEESWRIGEVAAELKETQENLERAKEESMLMAHCLSSLQEELESTKRELQQLKQRETEKHPLEPEINEDLKFVENLTRFEVKSCRFDQEEEEEETEKMEFQKKRYVTFANPSSESHVMMMMHQQQSVGVDKLERHPSLRRSKSNKKNKSFIPLIGSIFSRKNKPTQQLAGSNFTTLTK